MAMGKRRSSWKILSILAFILLGAGVAAVQTTTVEVQAATKEGWVQKNDVWYYYQNGRKVKGEWIQYNNKRYYLKPGDGAMAANELITSEEDGRKYYLGKDGAMITGWKKIKKKWYFFKKGSPKGAMAYGWVSEKNSSGGKNRFYMDKTTGAMYTDMLFKVGKKYYYAKEDGNMHVGWKTISGHRYYFTQKGTYTGWTEISGKWYYFKDGGYVKTGWLTYNGNRYYLSKTKGSKGQRLTGMQTINSKTYYFDSSGVMEYEVKDVDSATSKPGEARTIKNFLLGALQPVGNTLYVWGGGWAQPTATYIGVYPEWKVWYDSQSGSYDFSNYQDLSVETRSKGLDCSGFVGWSTYQVMETKSGVGSGYVAEASTIASVYASRGYGTLRNQTTLSKKDYIGQFKPGDVGSMSGHTFIVLGQCSDGSLVIVHSTPPCVQINGTPTPAGGWDSEAITLAQRYMNQYYPSLMKKFNSSCSVGTSYIRASNMMRWKANTLADPDGYKSKTAGQVLEDLFSGQ